MNRLPVVAVVGAPNVGKSSLVNEVFLREHPEAWSVGGPIRHAATTAFGKATFGF